MKKLMLTALIATCAASVFAQGTVVFNNRITGTLVTHVYEGGTAQLRGNSSIDTPTGAFDWTGYTLVIGNGYSAQLLGAPGQGALESALVAANPVTTFRTGTAAGQVAGQTATLSNVLPDAAWATVMMVAWENKGGLYPDWASAKPAWDQGLIKAGTSGTFDVEKIGGSFNGAATMLNLPSFNIYAVPEPSTFALAGLGAAAMLIFRRRK